MVRERLDVIFFNSCYKKCFVIIALSLMGTLTSYAADYYWIGGAGNWSDINHWATTSGGGVIHAVVPLPGDDVIFDANSGFTAGNNTVTVNVTANCHNITWVGALNSPTITGGGSNPLNIYGSMSLQGGMIYDLATTNFLSNSLGETVTTNGTTLDGNVNFGSTGVASTGEWVLQDNFTMSGSFPRRLAFNSGTLRTNNNNVVLPEFVSTGSLTRNLILGSSIIDLDYQWTYTGSNKTLNSGTSHIRLNTGGINRLRGSGIDAYYNITFTNSSGSTKLLDGPISVHVLTFIGDGQIENDNTIDTLVLSAGGTYTLQSGQTQTINNQMYASGNPCFILFMESSSGGSPAFLNVLQGDTVFDYTEVSDINASGSYMPLYMERNSTDGGGNTNIGFAPNVTTGLIGLGPDTTLACPFPALGHTLTTDWFFGTPFTSYVWSDASTADTLQINTYGQYYIDVNYGDGCVVSDTVNVTATPGSGPAQPGPISGVISLCGADSATYIIDSTLGVTGYTWSYSGAGSPTGTDTSIVFAPTTSGTLSVVANNACGSSTPSTLGITVSCSPTVTTGSVWTWTGCTSTDWFNPCNWDRGSIPNGTSSVIIPFTGNQPIISSGTAACFEITVQSSLGAQVELQSSSGGVLNVLKP